MYGWSCERWQSQKCHEFAANCRKVKLTERNAANVILNLCLMLRFLNFSALSHKGLFHLT